MSCLTLCDLTDCSTPGFPVSHYLWEFAQTHVHWVWCHPTISSSVTCFSWPQSFPASGSPPMSQLFTSGGQNSGISISPSVLAMNIEGWLSLEAKSINSLSLSLLYGSTFTSIHHYWKSHSLVLSWDVGKILPFLVPSSLWFIVPLFLLQTQENYISFTNSDSAFHF